MTIKGIEIGTEGLKNSNFKLQVFGIKEGVADEVGTFEINLYKKQFGYTQEGITCYQLLQLIEVVLKEKSEVYRFEGYKKALEHLDLMHYYINKANNQVVMETESYPQVIF